jgi:hypothetical protein
MTLYSIGNWLFLPGSLIFTGDATSEVFASCSLRSIEHLLASLLFTTGCLLFLQEPDQKDSKSLLLCLMHI